MVYLGRTGAMFLQKAGERLFLSASGFIPLGAPGGEDMEGWSPIRAYVPLTDKQSAMVHFKDKHIVNL